MKFYLKDTMENNWFIKKKQRDIEDIKDVLPLKDKMSYETIKPKIQKYTVEKQKIVKTEIKVKYES